MYHPQETNSLLDSTFNAILLGMNGIQDFIGEYRESTVSEDTQETSSFLDTPGSPEYERNPSLLSTINCKLLD